MLGVEEYKNEVEGVSSWQVLSLDAASEIIVDR
jgi:hypothetical protein